MRKNSVSSFVEKTWEVLQGGEHSGALKWTPEGDSFEIIDQALLSSEVLPRFFKHSNFSSFIRQLNMYNFHKRKGTEGSIQFYHSLFRRDHHQLLIGIRRKPSEAEILQGQEMVKRLGKTPAQQIQKATDENAGLPDWHTEKGFVLGQLKWGGWGQKKIRPTIIIIKSPLGLWQENEARF